MGERCRKARGAGRRGGRPAAAAAVVVKTPQCTTTAPGLSQMPTNSGPESGERGPLLQAAFPRAPPSTMPPPRLSPSNLTHLPAEPGDSESREADGESGSVMEEDGLSTSSPPPPSSGGEIADDAAFFQHGAGEVAGGLGEVADGVGEVTDGLVPIETIFSRTGTEVEAALLIGEPQLPSVATSCVVFVVGGELPEVAADLKDCNVACDIGEKLPYRLDPLLFKPTDTIVVEFFNYDRVMEANAGSTEAAGGGRKSASPAASAAATTGSNVSRMAAPQHFLALGADDCLHRLFLPCCVFTAGVNGLRATQVIPRMYLRRETPDHVVLQLPLRFCLPAAPLPYDAADAVDCLRRLAEHAQKFVDCPGEWLTIDVSIVEVKGLNGNGQVPRSPCPPACAAATGNTLPLTAPDGVFSATRSFHEGGVADGGGAGGGDVSAPGCCCPGSAAGTRGSPFARLPFVDRFAASQGFAAVPPFGACEHPAEEERTPPPTGGGCCFGGGGSCGGHSRAPLYCYRGDPSSFPRDRYCPRPPFAEEHTLRFSLPGIESRCGRSGGRCCRQHLVKPLDIPRRDWYGDRSADRYGGSSYDGPSKRHKAWAGDGEVYDSGPWHPHEDIGPLRAGSPSPLSQSLAPSTRALRASRCFASRHRRPAHNALPGAAFAPRLRRRRRTSARRSRLSRRAHGFAPSGTESGSAWPYDGEFPAAQDTAPATAAAAVAGAATATPLTQSQRYFTPDAFDGQRQWGVRPAARAAAGLRESPGPAPALPPPALPPLALATTSLCQPPPGRNELSDYCAFGWTPSNRSNAAPPPSTTSLLALWAASCALPASPRPLLFPPRSALRSWLQFLRACGTGIYAAFSSARRQSRTKIVFPLAVLTLVFAGWTAEAFFRAHAAYLALLGAQSARDDGGRCGGRASSRPAESPEQRWRQGAR